MTQPLSCLLLFSWFLFWCTFQIFLVKFFIQLFVMDMWSLELSQLIVKLTDGTLKCQVCPICCFYPARCNHDPEILKILNQEKEVALNLMVCFGIHLQGLWDWNFGTLSSGYFLLSRCSLGGHIVWFSWWVCRFAMVAISPPTLCAETQWWIMKTQSSKTLNTLIEFHRGPSRSLRTWPNVSGAFC